MLRATSFRGEPGLDGFLAREAVAHDLEDGKDVGKRLKDLRKRFELIVTEDKNPLIKTDRRSLTTHDDFLVRFLSTWVSSRIRFPGVQTTIPTRSVPTSREFFFWVMVDRESPFFRLLSGSRKETNLRQVTLESSRGGTFFGKLWKSRYQTGLWHTALL